MAISTIASVLIGWFLSLVAVEVFFLTCSLVCIATVFREWMRERRSGKRIVLGWKPLGGTALALAIIWIVIAVSSLVDIESKHRLFMSLTSYDHGPRTNWTESVIRTGVPPANPLYLYKQPASMRYYYFWLVDGAAVAGLSHLPVRAVLVAGCIWAGFALAALSGLFLKHFLVVGARLRRQFLILILLFFVSGVTICLQFWNMLVLHLPPPGDNLALVQIVDWLNYFLFYPHHVISMVCCLLAFLLASIEHRKDVRIPPLTVILIAAASASAFGLSVYVTFAFFLVMLVWATWQIAFQKSYRAVLLLVSGGAGAIVLLIPYLRQLTRGASKLDGGSLFSFFVRETLRPDWLLAKPIFREIAAGHPAAARNLANLIMLLPGYTIELGLPIVVLLVFLLPAWRSHIPLTSAQRSLVLIAVATIPFMSFIRSSVLTVNDFGLHSALFLQFPLLLLASELLIAWKLRREAAVRPMHQAGLPGNSPEWLRSLAVLLIFIGVLTSLYRATTLRLFLPFYGEFVGGTLAPHIHDVAHKAYIANMGYAELNALIPRNAVVEFNPVDPNAWWKTSDLFGVDHQVSIASSQLWCGSELGGDPSGCPAMAADIDAVYRGSDSQQARAVCRRYGIQYLVANVYDPSWQIKRSWVWTLTPVVAEPEFRALDCR